MPDSIFDELSPRLREVAALMCEGLPSSLICQRLGLSLNTVKQYRTMVLEKMKVSNTVELANKVNDWRHGQKPPDSAALLASLKTEPDILIIEDDSIYREVVVSSLKQVGFSARGVSNRTEMHLAIAEHLPDIVLLDLNLDNDDGLVIASELRKTRDCGIIMMTSRGMVEQRIDGLAMGADAYLVKPVDMRELTGVIRNLYRRLMERRHAKSA